MKDATSHGLHLKYKKEEKEAITKEEQELSGSLNIQGTLPAKSLLNTVYFCNGKRFSLRGGEHRNLFVNYISNNSQVIFGIVVNNVLIIAKC